MPYPILLLAAPRTGTSLLKTLLEKDKRILNLKELLSPTAGAYHPTLGFWAKYDFTTRQGLDDGRDYNARMAIFRDYLDRIQEDHPQSTILADLKYDQVGVVDTLWRMPDHPPAPLAAFLRRRAAVLHLVRRNPLAQHCSLQLAITTQVWTEMARSPQRDLEQPRLHLDTEHLVDALDRIMLRITLARHWIAGYPRVVDVHYEDLLGHDVLPPVVREPLEALLGLSLDLGGTPATRKIAPPLTELIENLDEVRAVLRGTAYEWCLDPDGRPPVRDRAIAAPTSLRSTATAAPAARRKVLFASELGPGLRELIGYAPLLDALQAEGIQSVLAVRDVGRATLALGREAHVMQAPSWPPHRRGGDNLIASHADVLARLGMESPARLEAMVLAWRRLLDLVEPDLVVTDNSPALLLALHEEPLPVIAAGNPFALPPLDYATFPPLRGSLPPVVPDARLLHAARKVQTARRRPRPASLPALFQTGERFVFGLAELDPYRSFRREALSVPPEGLPPPAPIPPEPSLYVELAADSAAVEPLVQAIAATGFPVEAFLYGDARGLGDFLEARGHAVHSGPPPLAAALSRASHVVAQAEPRLAAAAYAAGRPSLLVVSDEAGWYLAQRLKAQGVGQSIEAQADIDRARGALDRFLSDRTVLEAAGQAARLLPSRGSAETSDTFLAAILRAVRGGPEEPAARAEDAAAAAAAVSEASP